MQRWLAPDLALAMGVVALFTSLFLFGGTERLFRDSDTGWHIRTGERILSGAGIPRTDPYSFSKPAGRWMAWEWASDAVMGWLHRACGMRGVAWLFGLAIGAGFWLWIRLSWRCGGDFLLACAMLPALWTTAELHWLARPHVLGWLLLQAALMTAESGLTVFRVRHGALAFAAGALWANVHGSFLLGLLVVSLYGLGEVIQWLIWNSGDLRRAGWLARLMLCASAGTLANPYGWELHRHVAGYLRDSELLSRVAEFQSFNFHTPGAAPVLAVLLLTLAGAGCALAQRNAGRGLVLLFFAVVAIRSARGLPLAAVCALPLANGSLTLLLLRARGLRPWLERGLAAFLAYSGNLRKIDARMSGVAAAAAAAGCAWLALGIPAVAARTGFAADQFPVAAAQQVAALPAGARILAPDKFGGYLIYRFHGERKVFFDGRSDYYGAAFMKRYLRLMEARPGWRDEVSKFEFTHALIPPDGALRAALEGSGWRRMYEDRVAALLERPRGWQ
ncbi:MAG: hypothetical protein HY858_00620 [Candidatus Solibacter usitatus]|nr:hypothetical protein [Candidatus Solibacter usitatus]